MKKTSGRTTLKTTYQTNGTCSRQIDVELDGEIIRSVSLKGGCDGNTQGIAKLVQGMRAQDVIRRLRGIRCGRKNTSCPDQLSLAIEADLKNGMQ